MFERFTAEARRVVVLAQEEARLLDCDSIHAAHIVLGVLHESEGVATLVLETLGIDCVSTIEALREIAGSDGPTPVGHIPFTADAQKILELSLREALQLGHNHIGPEHILLGATRLVDRGESPRLAEVMEGAGLQRSEVLGALVTILKASQDEEKSSRLRPTGSKPGSAYDMSDDARAARRALRQGEIADLLADADPHVEVGGRNVCVLCGCEVRKGGYAYDHSRSCPWAIAQGWPDVDPF